ncbi:MAG: right-handed parallel beta-helix repeat-containing protein [Candidatus Rokubacteria bacterium]|nr:right-handed parallel beta-helix repeat-containing protein [Candidatus Rokubacteria bacterium]
MRKATGFVALTIAVLFGAGTSASAWTPPIGIPAPPFGINEVAPAVPSPWTGAVTGFYYVDNTSGAATDTANPNGWPAKPRMTFPGNINVSCGGCNPENALAPDSVVEVHGGPYVFNFAGPTAVAFAGTAGHPVFFRGVGSPSIRGLPWNSVGSDRQFKVDGSYYIIEGFTFGTGAQALANPAIDADMRVTLSGDHAVLRNNNLGPAYGQYSSLIDGLGSYLVIYNNEIHHAGNYTSAIDNKFHGLQMGSGGNSYIWILNNHIHHNGGQGMQVGADFISDQSQWAHHIYIGFNHIHEDMDAAVSTKQVRDVIISQNDMGPYYTFANGVYSGSSQTGHTATPTVTTSSFGGHNIWRLFNYIHDGTLGMRASGNHTDSPQTPAGDWYAIGNVVVNMTADGTTGGYLVAGQQNYRVYLVDNTLITGSLGGVLWDGSGYYEVTGNLIKTAGGLPMNHVPTNWGTNKFDYNFYDGTARLLYGADAAIISLTTMQSHTQEVHSKQGSALLDANYRPTSASPILKSNARSAVYDTFLSLYGIDIAKDIVGTPRPQGAAWAIGAYELSAGGGSPPLAPTGLIVR